MDPASAGGDDRPSDFCLDLGCLRLVLLNMEDQLKLQFEPLIVITPIDFVGKDTPVFVTDPVGGAPGAKVAQAVEDLTLPEPVDLAFCRFLLLHVHDPLVALRSMASSVRPGGWIVAQEPVTSAGRIDGAELSMPSARHPDIGALLPRMVREIGLELVDAWSEAPAGAGPGPVKDYFEELSEVDPGEAALMLPPLVTVLARLPE